MYLSPKPKLKFLAGGLALLLMLLATSSVQAHPADMFFQSNNLRLSPDKIHLSWSIVPGSLIASLLWDNADLDHDGSVSPAEAQAWAEPQLSEFTMSLNDTPLPWQLESVEWPTSLESFQVGDETIIIHLSAAWPDDLIGASQLTLHNQFQEQITINWFSVQAEDGLTFQPPQQANGILQLKVVRPQKPDAADSTLTDHWDSGTPSLEAAAADTIGLTGITTEAAGTAPSPDPRPAAKLTNLMRSKNLSVSFFLLAFAIAGVLGSLHALTPGHGKTVVAAYLIGAKGTTRHAVSLGAIVTLTHTGSVFALGLIALAASQYILPTSLFPVLEIASGVLIVGLGLYLLYRRWLSLQAGHHHSHDHAHDHHDHDHAHGHDHEHPHDHHHLPDETGITWRSLVTLGISGGLVPCPDAIAILLVAIAINRIALGLSLIVAFSLGLAVVLIVIGLILVHSRRLFERMEAFNRLAPAMPLVSAVVVLLLGLVLTFNAVRGREALAFTPQESAGISTPPLPSETPESEAETFDLDQARILYLAPDERFHAQLAIYQFSQDEAALLTQHPAGVRTFKLSPHGTKIVYSISRDDGGAELWHIAVDGGDQRQLVVCPEVSCGNPAWSPDGQRIVYEKLGLVSPGNPLGLASLWWLDIDTGQTEPVFPNSQWPGFNPTWSPDGQWLSYTSPGRGQVELYNLGDGRRHTLANQTGSKVVWQPDGDTFLIQDIRTQADGFFVHLLRFDLNSDQLVDLSEAANAEDNSPAWSPDGEWIAVVRRVLAEPNSVKDRQIWVMRPDGSEARALTHQPDVFYGALSWSPDGKYLLFHRTLLNGSGTQEIWLINVETGELQQIGSGQWPEWLP